MGSRWKSVMIGAQVGALAGAFAARSEIRRVMKNLWDPALLNHGGYLAAAVAGWGLFSLYWEAEARKAAAAKSSESGGSRAIHVILTNVALLLTIAPVGVLGRFLPVSTALMSAGIAIEAAGLALTVWARRHLGRYWSGEISIKVDHQLIRTGPYARLRHPIYTGLLVMYLGPVLVTGERLALVGFAMALFAYWRKIRLEEDNLRVAFGAEYEAYRRESWSLVPGIF